MRNKIFSTLKVAAANRRRTVNKIDICQIVQNVIEQPFDS